jgi:exo-beta-1,3-glucanase (GH17 family)
MQKVDDMTTLSYRRTATLILSCLLGGTLWSAGCSGGNDSPAAGGSGVRALPADFSTRKAVAYGGYRGATRNVEPTDAEILEDLQLLKDKGFGMLRFFSASALSQRVLAAIQGHPGLDFKVMLGIWISGPDTTSHAANRAAIDEGVMVANNPAYRSIVAAVSVGNETMIDWSALKVPPADMAAYIKDVRDRVPQPVTTDDNWAFFAGRSTSGLVFNTKVIVDGIDFVSLHTYPLADTPYGLWDWQQVSVPAGPARATAMMDAALARARSNFMSVKTYLDSNGYKLPIVVGETGWKSAPSGGEGQRAHPVNQKMYFDGLTAWHASPAPAPSAIFYFSAFDEPWKGGDDMWGLFTVLRKEKYVVWGSDGARHDPLPAPPNDGAVYYMPPVANPPVTQNKYILYSETVDRSTDAQPTGAHWDGWQNGQTATSMEVAADASEGTKSIEITPIPQSQSPAWGWGSALSLTAPDDLTAFAAGGSLNFSIKTTYPGKLEVGFYTGSTATLTGCDVYMPLEAGQYGYASDGAWHQVSIPIGTLRPFAKPAFGMPPTATINLAVVSAGFVIADRYAVTSNAAGNTQKLYVDNVYWSR